MPDADALRATLVWIQDFLRLMASPPPGALPPRLAAVLEKFRRESPPWPAGEWYPEMYAILDAHHRAGCAARGQAPGSAFIATTDEDRALLAALHALFPLWEADHG